jgi:hypothetical protein
MIIQMTVQMSGGRYDDRQWPAPWRNFEVPDEEGRGLIRCGAAMEVVSDDSAPEQDQPEPIQQPVGPPYTASPQTPSLTAEEIAAAQAQEAAKTQPAPGDPKASWVEHAVKQGLSQDEAEGKTKAQLQQEYGGRM